ncbi:xylulokinase [Bowmanella dokdonensis]|uniref:Xylulose kinase n=1 Tax=Bowmanella dokdonensis TaxID=751969 RepID=A0A939DPF4_9ALTE|nr:xylulokinase [Bowmanella dokdonensis]MBN7826253.1 xylulokinase [Bowmanella dokdonensis]
MYLGIDLGTSGVKVILLGQDGHVKDQANAPLVVSRPHPLWSEQDPLHWWQALQLCLDELASRQSLGAVRAIGLSGQMHGATLLDKQQRIIRPAILWNDGRCAAQCRQLEDAVPAARRITGNLAMPGFTAPKLLWLKQFEPDNFAQIAKVLLPKDYLRFCLSGDFASDMSDSAGTLWLDVGKRDWSDEMLNACGLGTEQMPALFEGNQITGTLLPELASRWGMNPVPLVAGGGDNAAGAVGVGLVRPGQAMLSLGTSGVYFAVSDGFLANPESAVHSFCHALPHTWHLMSVTLSAASCLQWLADSVCRAPVAELLDALQKSPPEPATAPLFLPYLSGERTPHNRPEAKGVWFGLDHDSNQQSLTYSVLEGVGFALAQGAEVLHASGLVPDEISLIGGGSRSAYWRQLLADILNRPLTYRRGGEVGPALGAARLAQLAVQPETALEDICPAPELVQVHQPDPLRHPMLQERFARFKGLYQSLSAHF